MEGLTGETIGMRYIGVQSSRQCRFFDTVGLGWGSVDIEAE